MGIVDLKVGFSGVEVTVGKLETRIEGAQDWTPGFRVIDRNVGGFMAKQFETRGRHGGQPWQSLAPSTIRKRLSPASNPGGNRGPLGAEQPLWNTGELKASLQEVGGNSIRTIEPHRYERGTRMPRGFYAQVGAGAAPVRRIIPIPLPAFLKKSMRETLIAHFEGRLN